LKKVVIFFSVRTIRGLAPLSTPKRLKHKTENIKAKDERIKTY